MENDNDNVAIVPHEDATATLAAPSSIAAWFQQPLSLPNQCSPKACQARSTRRYRHPLTVASFDAVLPGIKDKQIKQLCEEFKTQSNEVPGPKPNFDDTLKYVNSCRYLCPKKCSTPHEYALGLGLRNALIHIMKLVGGYTTVNSTDTVVAIKHKVGKREQQRWYAWIVTGTGSPLTTDVIQMKAMPGKPPRPPTQLTYARTRFIDAKCTHPEGLRSTHPPMMTMTGDEIAAQVAYAIGNNVRSHLEVTHLDAIFKKSDVADVKGEATGLSDTTPCTKVLTRNFNTQLMPVLRPPHTAPQHARDNDGSA